MMQHAANENSRSQKQRRLIFLICLALGLVITRLWNTPTWQAQLPFLAVAFVLAIVSALALSELNARHSDSRRGSRKTSDGYEYGGAQAPFGQQQFHEKSADRFRPITERIKRTGHVVSWKKVGWMHLQVSRGFDDQHI